MNSIRGGPQLKDFTDFKKALQTPKLITLLDETRDLTLMDVSKKNINFIKDKMANIYSLFKKEAKIMRTSKMLIGTSKTLHHLHPDLLPPIDKGHTINFLKKFVYIPTNFDNFNTWWKAFLAYLYIAQSIKNFKSYTNQLDTSIPKIIDNAIIGYSSLTE